MSLDTAVKVLEVAVKASVRALGKPDGRVPLRLFLALL
jgi:hypothetical protein